MDAEKAAEELKVIRRLMERPVQYSTMSGLSGILAGCAALAGVAADWTVSRSHPPLESVKISIALWAGVFGVAFTAAVVLTRLRERRRGMPFWSDVKRRILLTIGPPFVVCVGLTAAIVYRWWAQQGPNMWGMIPAVWMVCYGLALWQVGLFSPVEVRVLGVAFLASGIVAAASLHTHPYWALGVTFGGFHIVYGTVVWLRHGG